MRLKIVILSLLTIFLFSGCSLDEIKSKFEFFKTETRQAADNVKTEVIQTKEEISNATKQVKEAVDSIEQASKQTSEALNNVSEAVDAIDATGAPAETTEDLSSDSQSTKSE